MLGVKKDVGSEKNVGLEKNIGFKEIEKMTMQGND